MSDSPTNPRSRMAGHNGLPRHCTRWTKQDVNKLYRLASRVTSKRAAELMGRTHEATRKKAVLLGISWTHRGVSAADLAREYDCHVMTVTKVIQNLYGDKYTVKEGHFARTRYYLPDDVADRIRRVLYGKLTYHHEKRIRHCKRTFKELPCPPPLR